MIDISRNDRNVEILAAIHRDVVSRYGIGRCSEPTDNSNGWDRDYFHDEAPWLIRRRRNALGDLKQLTAMASLVPDLPIAERWKSFHSFLRQANGCIAELEHTDAALGSIAGRGAR